MLKRFLFTLSIFYAAAAHAGAWTEDQGHFFVESYYARVANSHYQQHTANFYGEVGVISRWLTASLDGTLYRYNDLEHQGSDDGIGDFRLGLWTAPLIRPLHLAIGTLFGLPFGDPTPTARDPQANVIAHELPKGSGEFNMQYIVALGRSFGRVHKWPLEHYVLTEIGYWLRTKNFDDAFIYRIELGTRLPWRFIERFWFVLHFVGCESFADRKNISTSLTGLGNGVSYESPGFDVRGRIWRGLGAFTGIDGFVRAEGLPQAINFRLGLSYQR